MKADIIFGEKNHGLYTYSLDWDTLEDSLAIQEQMTAILFGWAEPLEF